MANQLPELQGTEKQVEWANRLRTETVGIVYDLLKSIPSADIRKSAVTTCMEWLMQETTAKFWIDSRYVLVQDLLRGRVSMDYNDSLRSLMAIINDNSKGTF